MATVLDIKDARFTPRNTQQMATPSTPRQRAHSTGDRAEFSPGAADRIPAVTVHAFYETVQFAGALEAAAADRRMARANFSVAEGGIAAAIDLYRRETSPHLIVVESQSAGEALTAELERLAEVCESSSRVVVIAAPNDVRLYRELLDRGVSDYLITPVEAAQLVGAFVRLFRQEGAGPVGRLCAFIGAKGGAGSSTIAHNVAWTMGQENGAKVVLADLDMPFGTAALDFNVEAAQGIAEAVQDTDRLDEVLFDRLLAKRNEHLSLLVAPTAFETPYDFSEGAFDRLLDIVRTNVPFLVLDVPNLWSGWARKTLIAADEVIVTAEPDLASLRNAKNLVEFLSRARPNDPPPRLVLNQVGVPKRPEIKPEEFAAALQLEPTACLAFDPASFGAAANKGRMIAELSPKSRAAQCFVALARLLAGRGQQLPSRPSLFSLARWWPGR